MSAVHVTVLPIATKPPRVSVQLTHFGQSLGVLVMTRAQWEDVFRPQWAAGAQVTGTDWSVEER